MKYFVVNCPRGHYGRGRSTEISFAIAANNAVEATQKAMAMPSVKHQKCCFSAREITKEEYNERMQISAYHRW